MDMKQRRFWLGLVGLCVAVACALAIVLAVVSAATALAVTSGELPAALGKGDAVNRQQKFTGVVTDGFCGARHTAADKNAAECTRACVKKGAKYVLVGPDKSYLLDGNMAEVSRLSGQRAQVVGWLEGNVVTVDSIAAAP
jgi:hypothetical protein